VYEKYGELISTFGRVIDDIKGTLQHLEKCDNDNAVMFARTWAQLGELNARIKIIEKYIESTRGEL
jgi:hypothetical protein